MTASAHRANARAALRGKWSCVILCLFLAELIGSFRIGPSLDFNVAYPWFVKVMVPNVVEYFLHDLIGVGMGPLRVICGVIVAGKLLLCGAIQVGQARFSLDLIDGRSWDLRSLFIGLPCLFQALVMQFFRFLPTVLAFLLMISPTALLIGSIPLLVSVCSMAMAPYILAEDRSCSGWKALRRSWRMMRGHRLALCRLESFFLVWSVLSHFTYGVGPLILNPYKAVARASFYRELNRQTEPQ